jgi:hypothetical protein
MACTKFLRGERMASQASRVKWLRVATRRAEDGRKKERFGETQRRTRSGRGQ